MHHQRHGWLVPFLAEVFHHLEGLSLINWWARRVPCWRQGVRLRRIEIGILLFALVEGWFLGLLFLCPRSKDNLFFSIPLQLILGYRLVDIMQSVLSVFIFQQVRSNIEGRPLPKLASPQRTLVLTGLNYLEVIVVFAILAYLNGSSYSPELDSPWDASNYSIQVAALLGPEASVLGAIGPILFVSEVFFALIFLTLVLATAVSLLPRRTGDK
ncbi:MAG: hypothetical protein HYU29_00075 [Chloroflexi bacterium]|nr:hypothetical protein [Chloroflexota bacterium]